MAKQAGAFGAGLLRAALDSSPLWGAGRVEDTYNLLGHALRKALGVIADQQVGAGRAGGCGEGTGVGKRLQPQSGPGPQLGRPRLGKRRWRSSWPGSRLSSAGSRPSRRAKADPAVQAHMSGSMQVIQQGCGTDPQRNRQLRKGVAKDRRIASKMPRCGTGARVAACRWMATNDMCCTIWTAGWCLRSALPLPMHQKPASPRLSVPICWPAGAVG